MKIECIICGMSVFLLCSCGGDSSHHRVLWEDKHLTNPMYELLGMTDEYISRFDYVTGKPLPDLVECFYPDETREANRFDELLTEHARLTGARSDWRKEIGPQGHICFYSAQWAGIINSFYVKVDRRTATLDPRIFQKASQDEMLQFLRGAYGRYGSKDGQNFINMANAAYKITTIADVLEKLGCSDIVIYKTPEEYEPGSYEIRFKPSPRIAEQLQIKDVVLEPGRNSVTDWKVYKRVN